MAKTKKEMRKMMANYAEIILRRNKYIKELQEQLKGCMQVQRINDALVAALLLTQGADSKDKAVVVHKENMTDILSGECTVMAVVNKELDAHLLWVKTNKQEAGE